MGGKERRTVVNEFISTFAANISLGCTGEVKTSSTSAVLTGSPLR